MNGAVDAASEQEAMEQLRKRGLSQAVLLKTAPVSPPAASAPQSAASPKPGQVAHQVQATQSSGHGLVITGDPFAVAKPSAPKMAYQAMAGTAEGTASHSAGGIQMSVPATSAQQTYTTKRGSNFILRFLFTQLANYQSAGVNPVQAFNQMAGQSAPKQYRDSLAHAAQLAAEGIPFSDVMAMYPDLYPAGFVGMVRAGEQGGYQPDAYRQASRLADQARKMNIWAVVMFVMVVGNLLLLWPCWMIIRAIVGLWNSENANYDANGFHVLGHQLFHLWIWPFGPLGVLTVVLSYFLPKWWLGRSNTYDRHLWALKLWSLKQRAVSESMQVFTWHLSQTSQAGLSPLKSFELSAAAIPNLVISQKFLEARRQTHEGTTLTQIMTGVPYINGDVVAMIQTGEMTGQVSEMMAQAAQMENQAFQQNNAIAGVKLGTWAILISIISFGVGAIIMALSYAGILHSLLNQ